jgi:hypothetical protein
MFIDSCGWYVAAKHCSPKKPGIVMARRFTFLVSLAALFLASCTSSVNTARQTVPADFRLLVGSGGGFAGRWTGHLVRGTDSVFSWSGRRAGEAPVFAGLLPADSLATLWQAAASAHLLDSASSITSANYVHLLTLSAGGMERTFQWEDTEPRDSNTPAAQFARRASMMLARVTQP